MSEGPSDYVVDQGFGLMDSQNDQQQPEVTQQPEPQQPGINPAWNDLLNQVPEGLRGNLTPHLKQWDDNYQAGLQKVHSQYEPYKPFLEQGVDPESLNNAMLIMQSLEQDPQKFAEALIEHYKLQLGGQGQQPPVQDPELTEDPVYDITQHPEFQRYAQMSETMAQALLAQNEQAEAAQAEADLTAEFAAAKQTHGEFDEDYVAMLMYNKGIDIDTAVSEWQNHVQQIVQNYRPPGASAPVLMGGGGGLPSQATPVTNLTGQQRRQLIAQTLANMEASGG
jgi:hypothetical protein